MSATTPRLTISFKEDPLQSDLLNYHDWSKAMRTFLKVHRVWQYVDKPIKKPEASVLSEELAGDPAVTAAVAEAAALVAAESSDQEVTAYYLIESNCSAETRRMYLEGLDEDPHAAWQSLREGFIKKVAINKGNILAQLSTLRLEECGTIRSFVQKHRDLARLYNEIARYTAGKVGDAKDPLGESTLVQHVCNNLPEDWQSVVQMQGPSHACVRWNWILMN
jgi:hypothetical protein